MMFLAKYAVIIVRVNIMVYLHVTDVLAFSNVQSADHGIMCAKQKRKAIALSIKRIEISAALAD